MSSWFSWLPSLPSLNITLPSSLQGRFISFVLKKSLGHFLKPGQLDSSQIDSKIGSGFVQINDLELDNGAINALISNLPVSLQNGFISSVVARVPWPNPLSSTLGFSIDSLHLTFHLLSPSSHNIPTPSSLSDSVASVAESFIHDELSPQEGEALWESFHSELASGDDPEVPGGLANDPFLTSPGEAIHADLDPAGVSIFATLLERLLARFEFDATNTKITLVHPDNLSITVSISEIRYRTEDSNGGPDGTRHTDHRGQRRTLSVSGLTISGRNLNPNTQAPESYTPTGNLPPSSTTPALASNGSPRPVSPSSSSSSSIDDETQFAMSQSLAFLPDRQPSPTGSIGSSMYQSAVSIVAEPVEEMDNLEPGSRTPSPMAQPAHLADTCLHFNDRLSESGEVMVSFGSIPILFHVDTPPPVAPVEDDTTLPKHERQREEGGIQLTLTLGIIACAFQAWQIRSLLKLANDFKFQPPENADTRTPPSLNLRLASNARGLVILLALPSSQTTSTHPPLLAEFFKWPLVPPSLSHSYVRLFFEAVSFRSSSNTTSPNLPGRHSNQSFSSNAKITTRNLTVGDVSLFYVHGASDIIPDRHLAASPILITDIELLNHHNFRHRHPLKDDFDPSLPSFEVLDWTSSKHTSTGFKLSLWRTKSNRRRNATQQSDDISTSPALTLKTKRQLQVREEETSEEVEVRIIPFHIFLDLGAVHVREISAVLDAVLGGRDSVNKERGLDYLDYSDGESNTPPAQSQTWNQARERRRPEKPVLEDIDIDVGYGVKEARVEKSAKRQSKNADAKSNISIQFDMVRVQIRCPPPLHHAPRSGALIVDLCKLRMSTLPVEAKRGISFADDIPQSKERLRPSGEMVVLGADFERICVAYCLANETFARSILSIGSLPSMSADVSEPTPSLPPRMTVSQSTAVNTNYSKFTSLSMDIPSVVVDASKPMIDGLQYWADDVAQYMDRAFAKDMPAEKTDSRDTSLIGSRYFGKSRSGSGSAWSASSEGPGSEVVLKVNISEAFVRAMVPRARTLDVQPFVMSASDIDMLVEPNVEGKNEMVLTVSIMDMNMKDVVAPASVLTYMSLGTIRSLTSPPKPMVNLRLTSLVLPETTSKESRVKLTLSGCTFTIYPDLAWVQDLAKFAQSPPGTFESVIPSERTRVTLKIFDGAIRAFAPTHPGSVVVQMDGLNFATDVVGDSLDSSFQLSVPTLALLAVDDISNEAEIDTSTPRHGTTLWKSLGFALIAEVEDLSTRILHTTNYPATNILIDRVRFKVHLAADSLSAVAAFVNDLVSTFQPPKDSESNSQSKPNRGPTIVPNNSSEPSVMASIDDLAFRKAPEVGPAPDMISDDLPTNLDYLDESFGAAAGLRELRDDDVDEFDNDELLPDSETTTDGTGVVSRVGGETIKMLRPEGINAIEHYFDSLPPHAIHEELGETSFQLRVNDADITLFLYDGYDWPKTRKTIEQEVKEMRRRLAKIRQLVATGQVHEPSAEDTGTLLFNSIYIGLDRDVDGLEPGAIIAAIDQELEEDADGASQSSWQSLKPPASGKPQNQSIHVHGKRLMRSRGPSMEFCLSGLQAAVDHYIPDSTLLSRTLVTVRDVEILDHIKTSTWKKFLTELRTDSRGNIRETDSNMVRVELLSVQPVPGLPAKEARLRAKILPLRLYVDQDAVDFLKAFFSFKDPHTSPTTDSDGEEIYFQSAEVFPVDLKLDYKPRRVDYRALREGRTIELMNFFHFDGAEMTLRHITLAGITGWARLGDLLNDLWTPDVKATQLVEVISGVAPIRSVVNVGSGVADLVLLPISQYKKDGRIVRGVQKGTTAFVKSTAIEAIKLGARLATGTQVILEQAEGVLGGQFSHPITAETVTSNAGEDFTYLENDGNEDPADTISKYAQQPVDIREGVQSAYKSLRRNLNSAAQTILAVPMEVYERSGNEGPVRSVIRAVPIAVLKPMIGASEAVSKTLLGLHNSLDPDVRHENEAKYKRR